MEHLTDNELEELRAVYERHPRDSYLQPNVARRADQIRAAIDELIERRAKEGRANGTHE